MEQEITAVENPVIEKYSPDNNPDDFFCLKVSDNAAEPKFMQGDVLVVKKSCIWEYDGQLLVVAVNGHYLLRIYGTDLVTDEDRFEILGYPVYLQRDLEPVYRKEYTK